MNNFTPGPSFLGGILIGLAVVVLYRGLNKYAGISGIASQLTTGSWTGWGLAFLAGLPLGGLLYRLVRGGPPEMVVTDSWPLLLAAGLLVGLGTRLGNGCTSGHGICGLGRFSLRSLVATLTFMGTAALVVWIQGRVG